MQEFHEPAGRERVTGLDLADAAPTVAGRGARQHFYAVEEQDADIPPSMPRSFLVPALGPGLIFKSS
jgi:hypothetical protein